MKTPYWISLTLRTFGTPEEEAAALAEREEAERAAAAALAAKAKDEKDPKKPKFSQEDVDGIVSKRVNEVREDLKKFADQQKLTEEQRKDLESRLVTVTREKEGAIETLRTQVNTLEQKLKDEQEKLTKEAKTWEERYKTGLVNTEITAAAAKHQAIDPMDIIKLVTSDIRVTPEVDGQNKPTGQFKVSVLAKGENNKDVLLTPDDFVAQFKAKKPNFFRGAKGGAGTGEGSGTGGGEKAFRDMTKEEKMEYFRKKGTPVGK